MSVVNDPSGFCKVVWDWLLFALFEASLQTAFHAFVAEVRLQISFQDLNFSLLIAAWYFGFSSWYWFFACPQGRYYLWFFDISIKASWNKLAAPSVFCFLGL